MQIDGCANVSFINGDLEGDGIVFNVSDSIGIIVTGNNVAVPGSYTKDAVDEKSTYMRVQNSVDVYSEHNVFMNWNKGPLATQTGDYLVEPGSANRFMNMKDFQDSAFSGVRYLRTSTQTIPTSAVTIINFDTVDYDVGTFVLNDYSTMNFSQTSAVTTGASWKYTAPRRAFYDINAKVVLSGINTASEVAYIAIFVDGVEKARSANQQRDANNLTALAIDCVLYADTDAEIDTRVFHNAATADIVAASTQNWLSIAMLGAK